MFNVLQVDDINVMCYVMRFNHHGYDVQKTIQRFFEW